MLVASTCVVLALTSQSSSPAPFLPLPPAPELPCLPVLERAALHRGATLQLWGRSQFLALTKRGVPTELKRLYSFDNVIAVPRDAHNSMCSSEAGGQQCGVGKLAIVHCRFYSAPSAGIRACLEDSSMAIVAACKILMKLVHACGCVHR